MFPIISGAIGHESVFASQRATSATTANGSWIDTSKYEGNLDIIVNCGAASASDTMDFAVVESDTASGSGSAVPSDALFDPATGANATFTQVTDAGASFQVLSLKLERIKKYVRVNATSAGASGISIDFSVSVAGIKKYVS